MAPPRIHSWVKTVAKQALFSSSYATGPFESLLQPTGPFSERKISILMHKNFKSIFGVYKP
jgi:hypothetical protein